MISRSSILTLATALCFAVVPAFAQHPRGPGGAAGPAGAGGSHGPAMNSTASNHSSMGMGETSRSSSSSPTTVLNRNSKLDSHLTSNLQSKGLLPAGTDLKDTCAEFRNLGQCIAAIHVAHNLKIDFNSLACDMTLKPAAPATTCPAGTGSSKMSLGKSIQALSPVVNSKSEAKTGQKQANADIKDAQKNS
jgi:hypothetical protein